jgi:hypothetical protein
MFISNSKNGFTLKAYKGSLMTLLTMNLDEKPAEGTFAGFTIFYSREDGSKRPIMNLLNFKGSDTLTGSDVSPIQAFKWVHFPGSYQQTGMLTGDYTYEATPRFFNQRHKILPLDDSLTVKLTINVSDFNEGKLSVGFTRGFTKSQAYANRYGARQKLIPKGDWMFDTNQVAGANEKFGDFTYEDMYVWLGFNARRLVYGLLKEALNDPAVFVDMFAYDFNDPVIADMCLQLASMGRIRIIIDNAALHTAVNKKGKITEEDDFENKFKLKATGISKIFRCHFARYSHCKEIILKKDNAAYKVLTGSTNFSYTGLYVNANHVLVFDDTIIATYYADVFNICWENGNAPSFRTTQFAQQIKKFSSQDIPETAITVSPHAEEFAKNLIDSITAIVTDTNNTSVLFSVMEMGESTSGSLIKALRELHKDDSIYTYGITDNSSGQISLYKPGKKTGILIDAKKASRELPPPFKEEFKLGLFHAIHHKFIVTNFNKSDARVYCGSSNLALGGEKDNGDNLICINDPDVATVFAIEALRLTDHYNFRSIKQTNKNTTGGTIIKPAKLDSTGRWVERFFDENDIRFVERNLLG